jgi:hypothetical protein
VETVSHDFDPGALLASSYRLADGTRLRLRLRLVAAGDAERIRRLLGAEARWPARWSAGPGRWPGGTPRRRPPSQRFWVSGGP